MRFSIIQLTGTLTANSPLAVNPPDSNFVPFRQGLKVDATVQRLPRIGGLTETAPVYFPQTTLRGALRRVLRDLIRECSSSQWTLRTHFMLTQGYDIYNKSGETKQGCIDITANPRVRAINPCISLFGRWGLEGRLHIDNAYPSVEDAHYIAGHGVRSGDFERSPEQADYLTADDQTLLAEFITDQKDSSQAKAGLDNEIFKLRKAKKDAKTSEESANIQTQIAELENQKKSVKSEKGNSVKMLLPGYEAIRPGVVLDHKMRLAHATQLELGMFLATLREFSKYPVVGAHRAHGCGEISGSYVCSGWNKDDRQAVLPETLGSIDFSSSGFKISGDLLVQALNGWDKCVADGLPGLNFDVWTLDELDSTNDIESKQSGSKKAKGSAA